MSLARASSLVGAPACVRASQMCLTESECRTESSCVAGRCVTHGAAPAIATARRMLYPAVDVAYVRAGDTSDEGMAVAALGCGERALLLLRFAVRLPPEASVVEAYLLLERATEVDDDPAPLALHAARVTEPWDSASISWARQPHIDDLGAPVTRVGSASGPVVRLDVRDIVRRWRRRARDDFGLAVLAEGTSSTGFSVALAPALHAVRPGIRVDPALAGPEDEPARAIAGSSVSPGLSRSDEPSARAVAMEGPELELYLM